MGAADQHLTRENSFVKSMYLDDDLKSLTKGYHYRIDGGRVKGVSASENALFVFDGITQDLEMDNSLLTIEGGLVQGVNAKNSRIAIRSGKAEWAGGGEALVSKCSFTSCEVDMFGANITGSSFKNCRVNLFDCTLQSGLSIDGYELYLHKGKIKGNLNVTNCTGEFGHIGMEGSIILQNSDIGMTEGNIVGKKGPCVKAKDSSFRADRSAFESLKDPGCIFGKTSHLRLTECIVTAERGNCIVIEKEQCSATLIRGQYATSSGDCISVKAGAKAYLKLVDLVSANGGSAIIADVGGIVLADAVNQIYGQNAAVYAGNGSMCYFVGCGSVSSGGSTVISLNGGWCVLKGGMELGARTDIVTGQGGFATLKLLNPRYGQ